jgi:raffinose synthase
MSLHPRLAAFAFETGHLSPQNIRSLSGWTPLPGTPTRRALLLARRTAHWVEPRVLTGQGTTRWPEGTRGVLLLAQGGPSRKAVLWLPLPGAGHRAHLEARDGRVGVAWVVDDAAKAKRAPLWLRVEGEDADTLVGAACERLRSLLPGFRPRSEKATPPWLDTFGWCTWDAFYHEVSTVKVLRGLRSLANGGFAPRWMILDDGWQDTEGWTLRSTAANTKFPGGLARLTAAARKLGVEHFGVWHALHGYWHGLAPNGPLGAAHPPVAVPQTTKEFTGWPEAHDPRVRQTLPPERWAPFYDEFYAELAAAGVAFTKVDGQANTEHHANSVLPAARLHEASQRALQGAAAVHLRAGLVHCMAHAPDIFWRLAHGNVWRNSDDFYPNKPFDAQARHLVDNAYNAILFGELAWPDWDMFHSRHRHAWFHGVARALSGGPLFVSDKPGRHDFGLLRRLVLPDGRVPRFPRPGRPPARWLFVDPLREAAPLVLANASTGGVAAVAFFHCGAESTAAKIEARWRASDLPGLAPGGEIVIHDPVSGASTVAARGAAQLERLPAPGAVALRVVSPIFGDLAAPLGLSGMPGGAAAVEAVETPAAGSVRVRLAYPGNHDIWCRQAPATVWLDGDRIQVRYDTRTKLLRLTLRAPGTVLLTFALPRPPGLR